MDFPLYYSNGLPQLPYHKEEAALAIAGNEILKQVTMVAPFLQVTKLTNWRIEETIEQGGYQFIVLSLGPLKRLLYQPLILTQPTENF